MLKIEKRNIKGVAFMYIFDEGKKQPSPNCVHIRLRQSRMYPNNHLAAK